MNTSNNLPQLPPPRKSPGRWLYAAWLGVSILPEMSFKNYLDLPVESRELREKPYRSIGIIYRHWDQLSPLSRILINEAKDFFSKLSPKNSASHLPWFSELDCSGKNQ